MIVELCRLTLVAEQSHSLKEKRNILRALKDRVLARHKVKLVEVGGQETWQRAELGFAIVGSDASLVQGIGDKVLQLIGDGGISRIVHVERETVSFGDSSQFATTMAESTDGWVPESWAAEMSGAETEDES